MIRRTLLLFVLLLFVLIGCAPESTIPAAVPEDRSVTQEKTEAEAAGAEENAPDTEIPGSDADVAEVQDATGIDENGSYTSRDDVALYLHTYGHLPENFITKDEARALGWEGGSVEEVAPGKCIGGDHFGNYEELLPEGNYRECDIDTLGKSSRGAKRLIYDDQGNIYYTEDHYESFTQLY